MGVRQEVLPFLAASVAAGAIVLAGCRAAGARWAAAAWSGAAVAGVLGAYMLYFFRDPERTPPTDPSAVVSGADGRLVRIVEVDEPKVLGTRAVRLSIFLSLFDVHVNRAPIAGVSRFLGYRPGKHLFTFTEKSSEVNQHNAILIEGQGTKCLVHQIVGPVARRVVYWPDHDRPVELGLGDRIGMMKFGSRLDMYLPRDEVVVVAREGDVVRAGETVLARVVRRGGSR
jgi:phosphatidylserine decarboxylase